METSEKIYSFEKKPKGPKEKLLDASKELFFDDEHGGLALEAYRRHLKDIAEFVNDLESRGFEVWVESIPKKWGYTKIYIRAKGEHNEEVLAYEQNYSPLPWEKEGDFRDPYPNKKSLKKVFEEAVTKLNKILKRKYPAEYKK